MTGKWERRKTVTVYYDIVRSRDKWRIAHLDLRYCNEPIKRAYFAKNAVTLFFIQRWIKGQDYLFKDVLSKKLDPYLYFCFACATSNPPQRSVAECLLALCQFSNNSGSFILRYVTSPPLLANRRLLKHECLQSVSTKIILLPYTYISNEKQTRFRSPDPLHCFLASSNGSCYQHCSMYIRVSRASACSEQCRWPR